MARIYLLMFGAELLLAIFALISCISARDDEVRALPRFVWLFIILLFPIVGPIVYLVAGRPETAGPQNTWRAGGGFPEAARPQRSVAPDDDPEFLRSLRESQARADEEMLKQWEADLRRREDDLRRHQKPAGEPPSTSPEP
jgi:phospholipase D-like protein